MLREQDPDRELVRERRELDRQWVRDTATCPTCHAELGEPCIGRKFLLDTTHKSRIRLATEFLGVHYQTRS